ncbi:hypothetical protein OsI_01793 [Oryza sativa Indica Group]|uniref:Uncharacterized protein n=1 Tax=Oryza sativa subsp. indica TaxID=39946 RepID=A2WPL1_ORYSI|nr:hypothetical protein OsI_01793 [Oryza sativa Indica Group]
MACTVTGQQHHERGLAEQLALTRRRRDARSHAGVVQPAEPRQHQDQRAQCGAEEEEKLGDGEVRGAGRAPSHIAPSRAQAFVISCSSRTGTAAACARLAAIVSFSSDQCDAQRGDEGERDEGEDGEDDEPHVDHEQGRVGYHHDDEPHVNFFRCSCWD